MKENKKDYTLKRKTIKQKERMIVNKKEYILGKEKRRNE